MNGPGPGAGQEPGRRGRLARPPRAVIFDLDGTLTEPLLDFSAIRREIGIARGLPILEAIAAYDPAELARAEAIMRRHELAAIEAATLADGCRELLALLAARRVPAAILTRNVRDAVDAFAARFGFRFPAVYTREDGPPKPAADGARSLCTAMGVAPADTLAVGDYKYDIMSGRAAGCATALVTPRPPPDLAAWGSPDLVVPSLRSLLPLW